MPGPRINPIPPQPQAQIGPLPTAFFQSLAQNPALSKLGADQTLGAVAGSFPVLNITSGSSLLIVGRIQGAAGTINFGPRFNADSANNYGFFNLFSTGAGAQDGASAVSSFLQVGQASNTTSAAFACFIPGPRIAGLINNPAISICGSAAIVLMRSAWWNQGLVVNSIQFVADGNMAVGSYIGTYELL